MHDAPNGTQAPEAAERRKGATEAIPCRERMRIVSCGVLAAKVLY